MKWASLRTVGDSTIREIAHDFARQQQQLVAAVVIIDRDSLIMAKQADVIQGWKDQEAYCQGEREKDKKKAKAGKFWRSVEGIIIGAAAGIIIGKAL